MNFQEEGRQINFSYELLEGREADELQKEGRQMNSRRKRGRFEIVDIMSAYIFNFIYRY